MSQKGKRIEDKAFEILKQTQEGIRWKDFVTRIEKELGDVEHNTVVGNLYKLVGSNSRIEKIARGVYRLKEFSEDKQPETKEPKEEKDEAIFYQSFADWLEQDLGECTKVISLGGNRFRRKWGTPDVIGVYKPDDVDPVKFHPEYTSAEIKISILPQDLITAFGQACSYSLFSHKVYIVIPNNANEEDVAILDSLCGIMGIGLVLFSSKTPENPSFEIRVRPRKREPDWFYLNKILRENEEIRKKL